MGKNMAGKATSMGKNMASKATSMGKSLANKAKEAGMKAVDKAKAAGMGALSKITMHSFLPSVFSFSFNLSSPRPAKTVPFVILLCLTPDDFTCQWRASGWERVN